MNVEIGTETRYSFSENICFKFSAFCLCSVVSDIPAGDVKSLTFFYSVAHHGMRHGKS
jgi:hypothetical protein